MPQLHITGARLNFYISQFCVVRWSFGIILFDGQHFKAHIDNGSRNPRQRFHSDTDLNVKWNALERRRKLFALQLHCCHHACRELSQLKWGLHSYVTL